MMASEKTALLQADYCRSGAHVVDVLVDSSEYEEIFSDYEISSGLSLEELLPYKDDPWWQNLRRALFFSCWLTLGLTFLTACGLSYVQSGTCPVAAGSGNPLFIENAIGPMAQMAPMAPMAP